MRKTILFFSLLCLFIGGISNAQTETRVGGFLAYGTEIENLGLGVNAEFSIMENLMVSPAFIYYFPKNESGISINWYEFNANANYYFLSEENMQFYGIGGLNYSHVKVSYDGPFDSYLAEVSDGRVGLNLGGGVNFNIGKNFMPFTELKYVIIDGGQLAIAGGVKFNL